MKPVNNPLARFAGDPFIAMVFATVVVASLLPVHGVTAQVWSVATVMAIMALFFLHGVRLERQTLLAGLANWPLHVTILAMSFVLFPLLGLGLSWALGPVLPHGLWVGVLFLCAVPSTVQSAVVFTSIARGNVAGAVAAAAASNMLGIVLTPLLVGLLAGSHGGHVSLAGMRDIGLELCAPFVLGHLLRPLLGAWVARRRLLAAVVDKGTILMAVYGAFSGAVVAGLWHRLPPGRLVVLFCICAFILAAVLLASWYGGKAAGFGYRDRVVIQFCGSKKSLASGISIAQVLFGSGAGAVVLPLLLFHPLQLIVCAWLAQRYRRQNDIEP